MERKKSQVIMEVDTKIVKKYNRPGPRYTSYPPANLFEEGFTQKEYLKAIEDSNTEGHRGISLYIHVPFCPQLCHFCGCNTQLGSDQVFIERYFNALVTEIDRIADYIDRERPVTQIHWGGGTPNSVEWSLVEMVMDRFNGHFRFSEDAEIAMECSPAYLDRSDVDIISGMGFNRISLGIQDFNESVLKIINRKPPKLPIEEVANYIRSNGHTTLNLDFVYGLPGQTTESYLDTLKRAVSIKPDRLVTFSYAHVPWVKKNQKILEKRGIPGPEQKLEMLFLGYEYLTKAGYNPIGMDHYALPEDEMAEAFRNKLLHRNFQGYCTMKHTGQVYAFGASAISQLHHAYIQNAKETSAYVEGIEKNVLPVERGYFLNQQEIIIRKVINHLMCNGQVDFHAEAEQLEMGVSELKGLLHYSKDKFNGMENDGLLYADENKLTATPLGMLLIRVIAQELDPNYSTYHQKFSKTI